MWVEFGLVSVDFDQGWAGFNQADLQSTTLVLASAKVGLHSTKAGMIISVKF